MTISSPDTEAELRDAVIEQLARTPSTDPTDLDVTVDGDRVTIFGHVGSLGEKAAARAAAEHVVASDTVVDRIEVQPLWRPSDAHLALIAAQALQWSTEVPEQSVKAQVHSGVITLTGIVRSAYQRDAAGRTLLYLRGVTGLENLIKVRTGT